MQDLRANTITIVRIGSFVDATDGVTPETGVTLGAADQAELIKHGSTTVVDLSAATWAAITGADGWYALTLTASHTDTEGQLEVIVQDASLCLPVVVRFRVLSEAAYDSLYAAKDDGFMDVNIKTIGRADTQETEATNLEAACAAYSVTRGLAGTALPAAAADAAGGLPISDAGGLDLDTILDVAISTRLAPTTAGRTLDVEAGGCAGIDWGNIENQDTTVFLTMTTLATVSQVVAVNGGVDTVTTFDGLISALNAAHGAGSWETATGFSTHDAAAVVTALGTGSSLTSLATAAALATVDANVDAVLVDTGTTLPASLATIDANVDAILVDTGTTLPGVLGTPAGADLAADIAAVKVDTAATLVDTAEIGAAGAGLTAIYTTAMTEGYRGTGSTGSIRDLLYELVAHMGESTIAGTTKTLKKLDGSTTAKTYTLDNATTPTSITETT